jgi:hypothetical protein
MAICFRQRSSRILLACLSAFLLGVVPIQASNLNDLSKHDLVGPVKTVITKHLQLRTVHQFDRNGRLVELELMPTNGAESSHYFYHHDASGRLIEEETVNRDGDVVYKKLYRYGIDEEGRESAVVAATEDGELSHADFSFYDERGILVEEVEINGGGTAERSLYDVGGHLVYGARYFNGKLMQEATHHYGPLGRLTESRYYSSDGNLMRKDLYRYNEAGQRIEQQSEFMRSAHLRRAVVTYEIDEAGNWTKETVQRWTEKNGSVSVSDSVVSREREIAYY